jgi:hypothetical protein
MPQLATAGNKIPVTVLTGFLGGRGVAAVWQACLLKETIPLLSKLELSERCSHSEPAQGHHANKGLAQVSSWEVTRSAR